MEYPSLQPKSNNDAKLLNSLSTLVANLDAADATNLEARDAMREVINGHGRIDSVNLRTLLVEFSWDMRQRRFKRGVHLKNFVDALQIVRDMDEEPPLPDDYRVASPPVPAPQNKMVNSGDLLDIPDVQNPWPNEHKDGKEANAGPPKPWSCPTCTFENKPDFLICDMCGVVKPLPAELEIPPAASSSSSHHDVASGVGMADSPVSANGGDEPMPAELSENPPLFDDDEAESSRHGVGGWAPTNAGERPSKMAAMPLAPASGDEHPDFAFMADDRKTNKANSLLLPPRTPTPPSDFDTEHEHEVDHSSSHSGGGAVSSSSPPKRDRGLVSLVASSEFYEIKEPDLQGEQRPVPLQPPPDSQNTEPDDHRDGDSNEMLKMSSMSELGELVSPPSQSEIDLFAASGHHVADDTPPSSQDIDNRSPQKPSHDAGPSKPAPSSSHYDDSSSSPPPQKPKPAADADDEWELVDDYFGEGEDLSGEGEGASRGSGGSGAIARYASSNCSVCGVVIIEALSQQERDAAGAAASPKVVLCKACAVCGNRSLFLKHMETHMVIIEALSQQERDAIKAAASPKVVLCKACAGDEDM